MRTNPEFTLAREQAEEFIRHQTQFQLGFLETEKPHPKTRGLGRACLEDLPRGLSMLQSVDRDILPRARSVFASQEFRKLCESLEASLRTGGRIVFSGCGATGRLAILLEKAWRTACANLSEGAGSADRVSSLLTGGDYALIRSVESFEDYQSFGAKQAADLCLGPDDTLVAVTEGGETSSVIGSALSAAAQGARVFFVFNNPAEILCEKIERSRSAIQHPGIVPIELCTGPMAVAGSTRMQATTIQLLVLGHALETAFAEVVADGKCPGPSADPCVDFAFLLDSLADGASIPALANLTTFEADLYDRQGLLTYFAGHYLLDLLTDTTERAPTFMLPPFLKDGDRSGPPSWAFAKNPSLPTAQARQSLLGRPPRCLEWSGDDYQQLGAAAKIVENPPAIGAAELMRFRIGNEPDPVRLSVSPSAAMAVIGPSDMPGIEGFLAGFEAAAAGFASRSIVQFGAAEAHPAATVKIPCVIAASPLRIYEHLAAKLLFNTLSTATMARLGRIESNWMGWVEATNKKLIDRSIRLVAELCDLSYHEAAVELFLSLGQIETIVQAGGSKPSPARHTIERLRQAIS
jgi:N-acetylmuramic acid 6-phosphate etherase